MLVWGLLSSALMLVDSAWGLWLAFFVSAAGMGGIFPSFSALAANAVEASEQGATAGSIGAAQGLGTVIGPLAGTLIYAIEPRLPYLIAAVLLLLVAAWPIPQDSPPAKGQRLTGCQKNGALRRRFLFQRMR